MVSSLCLLILSFVIFQTVTKPGRVLFPSPPLSLSSSFFLSKQTTVYFDRYDLFNKQYDYHYCYHF